MTMDAVVIYVCWVIFHVVLERILPGDVAEGVPLSDGSRLKYKINGHLQFWLTIVAMSHVIPQFSGMTFYLN